ncbi:MAG: VWA domain-containing protein [Deltaproteobacteria bacterium]|nr:VWA domain-containing protein [Deltaproteobacteria bacterium]
MTTTTAIRAGGMEAIAGRLHGFAGLMRHNGVRVGTSEVMDAFQALSVVGPDGMGVRELFRSTLRTTLAKSHPDVLVFDRLFDLYFNAGVELDERLTQSLLDQLMEAMHGEGQVAALMQILQDMDGQFAQLTRAVLGAQAAQLSHLIQGALSEMDLAGLQSRLQLGYFAQRLLARLGVRQLETDLEGVRRAVTARLGSDAAEQAMATLQAREAALRDAARRALGAELDQRAVRDRAREQDLMDKSFARLSADEIRRMREAVRALAEKLKTVVRRRRVERRGLLDARHTLRSNLATGGVPVKIRFRRRKKERPQLAVLCDVSDSVRHVSMFMLQFVYTLQELFTRVRSFVFVADLGEVTELYRGRPVEDAVDLSVAGQVINLHANSNFGRAFLQFHREHLDAVTRNTTVIVLGDGRNNYNPAHAWVLSEWRRRARRLIWLCTEDRATWGFGDSEMHAYARHCDATEVVQNLGQLRRAVDGLLR